MKICSLSSGSNGNSVLVRSECTNILIDAGISGKKIDERLAGLSLTGSDLDALLVTHEHIDHIKSVGVLARKCGVRIFATGGTVSELLHGKNSIGRVDPGLLNIIEYDRPFMVGDILVTPFKITHDAAEPAAYTFECKGDKIGFATDLGYVSDYVKQHLLGAKVLYIESNHDVQMLEAGSYPYQLKERIKSNLGHLSNDACAKFIVDICSSQEIHINDVILAHLSEENNFPDLAYETAMAEMKMHLEESRRPRIHVAPRYDLSYIASTESIK